MPRATPLVAFAAATLGIAIFSGMDAVMKGLVLAIGAYNALLWRNLAGVVISGAVYFARPRKRLTRAAMRLHLIRGAVTAVMALLFFWGLARVPMAQAIALAFVAPLAALFLAAWLLGERIPRSAIYASLLAFAGVVVILIGQGQSDLGREAFWGAIAILVSALAYAWNIILMRQQSLLAGAGEVAFFQSLVVATIFSIAAPFLAVVPAGHAIEIVGSAILAVTSLFLLSWAYARGEASYLAPSEYTSFVWAALFGWLVFGETVSPFTLAGAALIVVGCVWAARRKDGAPVADSEAALP